MPKRVGYDTTTIANAATKSSAFAVPVNKDLRAIVIPSAFTGVNVSFENSIDDGTTYCPIYDEDDLYVVNVGTSRFVSLKESVFRGAALIKIVSDATEGGSRSIGLVFSEG